MRLNPLIHSLFWTLSPVAIAVLAAYQLDFGEALFQGLFRVFPYRREADEYTAMALEFLQNFGSVILPVQHSPLVSLFFLGCLVVNRGFHWIPFYYHLLYVGSATALFLALRRTNGSWLAGVAALLFIEFSPTPADLLARQSEGLAYPFLALVIIFFWLDAYIPNLKFRWGTVLAAALLIQIRPNLLLLIPLLLFWYVALYLFSADRRTNSKGRLLAFSAALFLPVLAWQSFNVYRGGTFSMNNLVWASLSGLALPGYSFTARAPEGDPDRAAISKILSEMQRVSLESGADEYCYLAYGSRSCHRSLHDEMWFQVEVYTPAIWAVLMPAALRVGASLRYDLRAIARLAEKTAKAIVLDTLRRRPGPFLRKMVLNFTSQLLDPEVGDYWKPKSNARRLVFLLAWLSGLTCLILLLKEGTSKTPLWAVGSLCFLLHLGNLLTISIFAVPFPRYSNFTGAFFVLPLPFVLQHALLPLLASARRLVPSARPPAKVPWVTSVPPKKSRAVFRPCKPNWPNP